MKLGVKIESPRFLAHAKQEQGDLGDNLPPGSPLEYFDLCEAHPKYMVEKLPDYKELTVALDNPKPNIHLDHLEKSVQALGKIGLSTPWL